MELAQRGRYEGPIFRGVTRSGAVSGEADDRILRVVTLEDGETIHNAFLDRSYREDKP